jgi:putative ABC transport system permease protein
MFLEDLVADLRFGWRMLVRHPGFSLVAILALAIGIGANTAVFTVADAVLFRPPPFDHAERLYWIYDVNAELRLTAADAVPLSPANFVDWRARNRSFDHMAAWRNWFFSVAGPEGHALAAEQVRGVNVSPAFFAMLGVRASLGRTLQPADEEPGRDQVVVLTDGFWRRRFGGDRAIIGKTVLVDGRPFSVVGVLPPDFYFLFLDSAIFMPMKVDGAFKSQRATHSIGSLARLAPGVTRSEAQSELELIAHDLERAYPATNRGWSAALVPVFPLNRNLRPALLLLLAAVGCVLLIACINVASLLLVRAGVRQREIAVRVAVGASRGRLIRQTLAESTLVAAIGAAGGVGLAIGGLRLLASLVPQVQISRPLTMTIDGRVLLFTLASAALTSVVLGILPALRTPQTEALTASAQTARGTAAGRALVAAEIALSLMLLVAATLLVRSLWNLRQVDPGFRAERLLTMQLWLPAEKYASPSSVSRFYQEVLRRIGRFPEVRAAAIVNTRPFLGWSLGARLEIPGRPSPSIADIPIVGGRVVSPGFLAALGTPLVRGRGFTDGDRPDAAPVALINETMARRFWPTEDPIGRSLRARWLGSAATAPWWPEQSSDTFTVVGIVGDIKERRLSEQIESVVYLSHLQNPARYVHLLVRTESAPASVAGVVQQAIRGVDADLGVYGVQTMEAVIDQAVAEPRLNSLLLWVFATIALLLSAIGVYGVMSYSVGQRTREFAIRMAIGAETRSLFGMVTREALVVAIIGISIGVGGALLVGRMLASLLYGVVPGDGSTLAAAAAVVLIVALLACWRPAWRATRVDPITVLRAE